MILRHFIFLSLLPLSLLLIWYWATAIGGVPPIIFPAIDSTLLSFQHQLLSGQLWSDLAISLWRVTVAFTIAALLGIGLGLAMGLSFRTHQLFNHTLNAIRQIPPLAWIPLLILWFGIGETTKIIMIVKSAFFPILLSTINGIQNTPKSFIELGELYQLNLWQKLRKIYLPATLPSLFVGLRLAMGLSWATVVAAEMIAADSGIGYRINDARIMLESPVIVVGIIVIGLVGIVLDRILLSIERWLLPWQNCGRGSSC